MKCLTNFCLSPCLQTFRHVCKLAYVNTAYKLNLECYPLVPPRILPSSIYIPNSHITKYKQHLWGIKTSKSTFKSQFWVRCTCNHVYSKRHTSSTRLLRHMPMGTLSWKKRASTHRFQRKDINRSTSLRTDCLKTLNPRSVWFTQVKGGAETIFHSPRHWLAIMGTKLK